ncbi:MAG: hypothetical protein LBQ48_01175, partial [Oscillospiraceae bacterium]|nr:hypothetical protein [Oscillospiraceae bacterium]
MPGGDGTPENRIFGLDGRNRRLSHALKQLEGKAFNKTFILKRKCFLTFAEGEKKLNFLDDEHRCRFWELIDKCGKRSNRRIDAQYAAAASILSTETIYPHAVNHVSRDGIDFPTIKSRPLSEGEFYMVS